MKIKVKFFNLGKYPDENAKFDVCIDDNVTFRSEAEYIGPRSVKIHRYDQMSNDENDLYDQIEQSLNKELKTETFKQLVRNGRTIELNIEKEDKL